MLKILETVPEGKVPSTLDELARESARRMLMEALDAEVADYVERHRAERGADGRALVVRKGRCQPRQVTTGAGTVEVQAPRVHDRRPDHRFTSSILPPYMRRSPKVSEVLPVLYLRGLSTGDFKEALGALLGDRASGLSASSITRMTSAWEEEYRSFRRRDLSAEDYVYVWADGVHFRVRLEDDRLCTLVLLGVRRGGTKELIAVEDGYRESAESWSSVLRDLKRRGLRAPVLAIARRRPGLLAGGPGRVARDQRAALLGASPRQSARQAAEAASGAGEAGAARDHVRLMPRRRRGGDRALQRGVRRQVPEGGRITGQG